MLKKLRLQVVLVLLSVGSLAALQAQTSTLGNISGNVRDPNGAAVPKAEIVIQEETTGTSRTVVADDNGYYSAPSLPAGRYTLTASAGGFKKTVNSGVELHVTENKVLNLVLQVGQVSETVTVSGETAPVETRSGEVSSLVTEKQVTELPLDGRNYAQLALMVPGVSPVTQNGAGGAFKTGGTGLDSHVDMSVNGNQSNTNMWTVDGVNNMDVGSNATLLVFPSIDSIKEFRVERNSFSAEYGQAQGAVINLITKSGSNRFHGAGFEFLRRDGLNATDPFLTASGQPKGQLRYNNFGGNFGGPIKKNKIFFFWSEEWRREQRGTALGARNVPTAKEKVGDFTGPLTNPLPTDPATGLPFPGNKIPTNRLSPVGLLLLKVYPDPNLGVGQWVGAPLEPVNTRQDSIRGDINITSKTNVVVRWINEKWTHGQAAGNFWGDTPFPTVSSDWDQPSNSFAVKLTNTLSSSAVNEFQFSRAGNDIFINTNPGTKALNDSIASAFPTVFPHPQGSAFPSLVWGPGGYETLWHEAPWKNGEDLFIWRDDFSKVIGSHDIKVGGLFSANKKNETNIGSNQLYTIAACNCHTGHTIADVLLKDIPITDYTEVDHQEFVQGRWRDLEFYGNDTWRVRSRVTLNLGLRWSRYAPPFSANDRVSNWIPRLYDGKNPLSALVQANQLGSSGLPHNLVLPYNKGFQPRAGVAWDIHGDGKTALRLGFGRYMSRSNVIEDLLRMSGNPPWTTTVDSGWQSGTNSLVGCPTCRSLDTINPGLKSATAGVGPDTGFAAVNERFRPPDSWQWNVTVTREVMKNTVVEASYIGNHGQHIWRRGINFNEIPPSARAAVIKAFQTGDPNLGTITSSSRRLKGVGPISMSESTGESHYNAFQLQVNRRFANRLAFGAAYTWGHAISNVPITSFTNGTTDPFNYNLDKGDADLDRRQIFIANGVYELPSFKGRGAAVRQVLGGWQFSGIASFVGGNPINVTTSGVDSHQFGLAAGPGGGFRPNLVAGAPLYLNNGTQWLNPAAFVTPPSTQSQFGSLGAGVVRMPATKNVDFALAKNWRFKERYGIQFRTELFNAFNHVNFDGINSDKVSGNFGQLNHARLPREIQLGFKFTF
jgi:Carboxypeptidase regulatory-like domain/TonB-dependent Receptor Plug Domain